MSVPGPGTAEFRKIRVFLINIVFPYPRTIEVENLLKGRFPLSHVRIPYCLLYQSSYMLCTQVSALAQWAYAVQTISYVYARGTRFGFSAFCRYKKPPLCWGVNSNPCGAAWPKRLYMPEDRGNDLKFNGKDGKIGNAGELIFARISSGY